MKASRIHPRGQELLEYALVLPIFLLMVFGIIDLARAAYYYSALQNAAREGARFAIVHTPGETGIDAMIAERVRNYAVGLDPADMDVPAPIWTDDTVRVIARYSFDPVTPLLSSVFPGGVISMVSSSTMLRENW